MLQRVFRHGLGLRRHPGDGRIDRSSVLTEARDAAERWVHVPPALVFARARSELVSHLVKELCIAMAHGALVVATALPVPHGVVSGCGDVYRQFAFSPRASFKNDKAIQFFRRGCCRSIKWIGPFGAYRHELT